MIHSENTCRCASICPSNRPIRRRECVCTFWMKVDRDFTNNKHHARERRLLVSSEQRYWDAHSCGSTSPSVRTFYWSEPQTVRVWADFSVIDRLLARGLQRHRYMLCWCLSGDRVRPSPQKQFKFRGLINTAASAPRHQSISISTPLGSIRSDPPPTPNFSCCRNCKSICEVTLKLLSCPAHRYSSRVTIKLAVPRVCSKCVFLLQLFIHRCFSDADSHSDHFCSECRFFETLCCENWVQNLTLSAHVLRSYFEAQTVRRWGARVSITAYVPKHTA